MMGRLVNNILITVHNGYFKLGFTAICLKKFKYFDTITILQNRSNVSEINEGLVFLKCT